MAEKQEISEYSDKYLQKCAREASVYAGLCGLPEAAVEMEKARLGH